MKKHLLIPFPSSNQTRPLEIKRLVREALEKNVK